MHTVQDLLGHANVEPTQIYTHAISYPKIGASISLGHQVRSIPELPSVASRLETCSSSQPTRVGISRLLQLHLLPGK